MLMIEIPIEGDVSAIQAADVAISKWSNFLILSEQISFRAVFWPCKLSIDFIGVVSSIFTKSVRRTAGATPMW